MPVPLVGSITDYVFFNIVQSVTSVEPVGTASPLAFQNCRGRRLNRPESKVMTNGTSQFFLAIFALATCAVGEAGAEVGAPVAGSSLLSSCTLHGVVLVLACRGHLGERRVDPGTELLRELVRQGVTRETANSLGRVDLDGGARACAFSTSELLAHLVGQARRRKDGGGLLGRARRFRTGRRHGPAQVAGCAAT